MYKVLPANEKRKEKENIFYPFFFVQALPDAKITVNSPFDHLTLNECKCAVYKILL